MRLCGSFEVHIVEDDTPCSPECINKGELSDYYTREEVDALLATKQDNLTAQNILDTLGYKETLLTMEDCSGTTSYHMVLAKEVTP